MLWTLAAHHVQVLALLERVAGAQRAEVRQLAAQQLRKCIARFWRRLEPQVPPAHAQPQRREQLCIILQRRACSLLGSAFWAAQSR